MTFPLTSPKMVQKEAYLMLHTMMKKFIGSRQFYKNLLILIIPIIIQQGITNFVNLLDNVMVGRLGTEPMSGVAIVNQLIYVFNLAIFGGLSGASIYGAQFFGKGDHDGVRYAFRFKIIYSLLMTAAAIGILYCFREPLISLFLNDSAAGGDLALTLQEAISYLLIMLFGLLPFALSQSYASTLREAGETVSPMIASCIAILTNLTLNYILIFGNFGAPRLGVAGAAIATVISRYMELLYLIVYVFRNSEKYIFFRNSLRSLYIPAEIVKKILITGSPLICNEILWSMGIAMINQCYSTRGLSVVAATNITSTAWNLFCVIMFAMGSAVSIIVGQQLGAGEIERAKDTDNKLIFFTLVLHIGIGLLIIACAPFVPLIYNTEPVVQKLATQLLRVAGAALPIHAFAHVTYFTLRCGGKTMVTFLFDCVFTWAVSFPIAFTLSRFTDLPVVWIYFCVQFADALKVLIGIILLRSGVWANNIVSDN